MQLHEWLAKTTAADVMNGDVLSLKADSPLATAAAIFLHARITGAPVVDESGTCVGVLSVSDVAGAEEQAAEERERIATSDLFNSSLVLPDRVYDERLEQVRDRLVPAAEQPLSRFMTSEPISVRASNDLAVVVRTMIDAHVHRVVVLDDAGGLCGIISTTDVLTALLSQEGK